MAWVIQSPSSEYQNTSMYYTRTDADTDAVYFTHDIGCAKEFETKEEAREVISYNGLDHCHILPS